MTDHAHELRRYARKIAHPAGDVPAVMLAAADEIERLQGVIAGLRADFETAHARTMTSAAAEREACKAEVETLRAKIEAMEKQEPVAWLHESRRDSDVVTSAVKHVWGKAVVGALAAYSIPLYLAPGAKGE